MQAVILAGGLGTRLRPLTKKVPKILISVGGRPFIDWVIDTLPRDLFDELLLLTGYLGDRVREYCGDGSRYGIAIRYSCEPQPLGTAGALRHASDLLGRTFVLLNGDTYIELDYLDLLAFHHSQPSIATMVVARPYDPEIRPNVRVEPDGRITKYAKGEPAPDLNAVDAGVAVFDKEVISFIPERDPVGLETHVFSRLVAHGQIAGYRADAVFYDIGTPEGLTAFTQLVARS